MIETPDFQARKLPSLTLVLRILCAAAASPSTAGTRFRKGGHASAERRSKDNEGPGSG